MRFSFIPASFGAIMLLATPALAGPSKVSHKVDGNCYSPRWSDDGKRFSYEVHNPKEDTKRVFIAPQGGGKFAPVKPDVGPDVAGFDEKGPPPVRELAWHPQGRAYVYGSTGGRSQMNLYMEGEGCLTCDRSFGYGNKIHPTWSPDGKWLAYAKQANDQGDIYIVDIYNLQNGPKKITDSEDETSYQPRFSPDGKKLLFTRFDPEKSDNDLYILDDFNDPKSIRQLTTMKGAELNASWSPDGSKVAFFANYKKKNDKDFDLYVVPSDAKKAKPKKGATRILKNVVKPDRSDPVWTPDGKHLIIVRLNGKKQNPLAWVSVEDSKKNGLLKADTLLNNDISMFPVGDAFRLAWTAQAQKKDKKKRWRKVYEQTVTLP